MTATCHGNTLNDYTRVAVSLIFQMPHLVGKAPDRGPAWAAKGVTGRRAGDAGDDAVHRGLNFFWNARTAASVCAPNIP